MDMETIPIGEHFRREELRHQLARVAQLISMRNLPLPVGDLAPVLEFAVASVDDVDRVAEAIGTAAQAFKDEYFAELNTAELRVRWLTTVPTYPTGFDYSRPADGDDPQPVAGRMPPHTGAVTAEGLVDESDDDGEGEGESFRFGMHDDKPLHFLVSGSTAMVCGLDWNGLPQGEGYTSGPERVTCPQCRAELTSAAE